MYKENTLNGNLNNCIVDDICNMQNNSTCHFLDNIFNSMHDGIYITDNNAITLYVNKSYENMSGLKKEDLIGRSMKDLIDLGCFKKSGSLEVIKYGKQISIIDEFKNGKKCLVTSNPVFDKNGKLALIITNIRDMTELSIIEEKIKCFEELNDKYINEIKELRNENLYRDNIIGSSKNMLSVYEMISRVAEVDTTVLIFGETGVGKEVIAKDIHKKSLRKEGPFIKINCASIPESLFESEIFGYEKGAFTGAIDKGKPGMFELAEGGTILLDEIGELSLSCQAKLLRIIQEKQTIRLGGTSSKTIDVRIIASTNRDLEQMVKAKEFREDLFYRISIIPIRIPPLRERKEDILLLSLNFLEEFNKKYSQNKIIDHHALNTLKNNPWPGNVRQLKNTIERLVLICSKDIINKDYLDTILVNDNFVTISVSDHTFNLKEILYNVEKDVVQKALLKYGTTRNAARVLGISQSSVVRRVDKFKIDYSDSSIEL